MSRAGKQPWIKGFRLPTNTIDGNGKRLIMVGRIPLGGRIILPKPRAAPRDREMTLNPGQKYSSSVSLGQTSSTGDGPLLAFLISQDPFLLFPQAGLQRQETGLTPGLCRHWRGPVWIRSCIRMSLPFTGNLCGLVFNTFNFIL